MGFVCIGSAYSSYESTAARLPEPQVARAN
jgi:hypothetical protein